MLWLLILPGLVVAYALFLRPLLRAMPALKTFYSEADGFWAKVWVVTGKSLTMAWGYLLMGIGTRSTSSTASPRRWAIPASSNRSRTSCTPIRSISDISRWWSLR
jgi:hypothetical protein